MAKDYHYAEVNQHGETVATHATYREAMNNRQWGTRIVERPYVDPTKQGNLRVGREG